MKRDLATEDPFGVPYEIGDLIVVSYRPNGGGYVTEAREIEYISSTGVPYYRTMHEPAKGRAGSTGPQLRAAKTPAYRVRRPG